MPTFHKPERLCHGDTIGIVAPASAPSDPAAIDAGAAALEYLGFKPKLADHVRNRTGFLAGDDRDRAADLMAMFTDPEVKGIICLRGGYGSARLLNRLDYRLIRRHRKVFAGFSDITSLHAALQRKVKTISFHSPMLNGGLAAEALDEFTRAAFLRTVMEARPAGSICAGLEKKAVSTVVCGVAEGRLAGGNLSILCASIGTPFQPVFKDQILFFEDVGEKPYRLDRMLTQLLNAGLLQQVAGVAVGVNSDCEDPLPAPAEYRQSSSDVIAERLGSLRVPVVTGLPFGHVKLNATLPLGVMAKLDGDNGDLIITEPAVA
jgi:muramoyltetrapeptide carboxypeptidase